MMVLILFLAVMIFIALFATFYSQPLPHEIVLRLKRHYARAVLRELQNMERIPPNLRHLRVILEVKLNSFGARRKRRSSSFSRIAPEGAGGKACLESQLKSSRNCLR